MKHQSRLCPVCRTVLQVKRFRTDETYFGEARTCPEKGCGYSYAWSFDSRRTGAEIQGVTTMKAQVKEEPRFMVPGDRSEN